MKNDSKKQAGRDGAAFSARHLDVVAFAEAAGTLAGAVSLSHYPRLAAENLELPGQSDDPQAVRWQAQGRSVAVPGGNPEIRLHLQAQASLMAQCQRCLEPMPLALEVDRPFRFVRTEAEAERLDEEIEDDVLAWRKDFDLHVLVEDELLMALPAAPRHAQCPAAPRMQTQTADFQEASAESQPHPFAALQVLKKKG